MKVAWLVLEVNCKFSVVLLINNYSLHCTQMHKFTFSTSLIVVSSVHVGAVNLQTHRTSLCPGDIGAVFICEANGNVLRQ